MTDRFSRWPEAVSIASTTADDIVNAIWSPWIARGSQFESAIFDSFIKLLGCSRVRTTAYHSASNDIIKHWHRSLKSAIPCHTNQQWTKLLLVVLLNLRTAIKEDIKASAAEMLYGESLRLPVDSTKKPLQPSYEGPYPVFDKVFKVAVKGQLITVSIERIKPAYLENGTRDSTDPNLEANPSTSSTPKTYLGPKTKKTVTFPSST
ncbi:uncharacterized protein LOC109610110 [Camponotus floridanus]|uniref:uncharacterized protein LOC109610110 n=1 Tax=Camponotus floridanus TaxID=104421 RepID=UPI0009716FA5|nr:uncharacterized protein LOC109610110 [Camponotus floridanus]